MHDLLQILDAIAAFIEHLVEVVGGGVVVMSWSCDVSVAGTISHIVVGFSFRFAVLVRVCHPTC